METCEAGMGGPLASNMRHKVHLLFTWAAELVRHPTVLDAVEDLIGPEITSNPIQHVRIKPPQNRLHADEILEEVWSGKIVTSGSIYNSVAELRQALADVDDSLLYVCESRVDEGAEAPRPPIACGAWPA